MWRMAGVVAIVGLGGTARAADDRIDVARGPDSTLFGSCVPSLLLTNRSDRILDYVQVDIEFTLRDGRTPVLAFKSRYREGVERPVGAGDSAALLVHGDESQPLHAPCEAIVARRVVAATCLTGSGPCAATIAIKP